MKDIELLLSKPRRGKKEQPARIAPRSSLPFVVAWYLLPKTILSLEIHLAIAQLFQVKVLNAWPTHKCKVPLRLLVKSCIVILTIINWTFEKAH